MKLVEEFDIIVFHHIYFFLLFFFKPVFITCIYPQVNMIVLGDQLGIPKPFGPQIKGQCALETEVCSLLEPLGLKCTFIDDFATYHKLLGEVHCGSNVRREPSPFRWWNLDL